MGRLGRKLETRCSRRGAWIGDHGQSGHRRCLWAGDHMTLTIYRADGYPKSARTQLVSIPRVTTLPASPFDGQEVYLVSASGALQHLRYYATGANWEYVGRAVQDEGSAVTVRNVLNFVGPNITTADDAANSRTNITTTVPVVSALPGSPVNGQE